MVQGLDALNRRWAAIPARVHAAARDAMEKQAEELVRDMRRLAPKGDTGELVRSISWTWGDAPAGSMVIGTVSAGGRTKAARGASYATLRVTIYAGGGKAFYAKFQEHGTVNMTANPFFFPVWRARRRRVRAAINRAIRRALAQS